MGRLINKGKMIQKSDINVHPRLGEHDSLNALNTVLFHTVKGPTNCQKDEKCITKKITTFMLHILSLEAMKNRLKFKLMFTENLSIMAVVTIVFKSMDLLPTYCIPLKN